MVMMAKSLDELLTLKGVIASGEFAPNGKLLDFRSKGATLPDDVALLTDQFATAVGQLLGALASAHGRITGLLGILAAGHGRKSRVNLMPEQGWAYSGATSRSPSAEAVGSLPKPPRQISINCSRR
jgi:roadblock/LC7 domain-containing protein